MKFFDLEKALKGEKVITRDGREVTKLVHFESYDKDYPVFAQIDGEIHRFTRNGELRKMGIDLLDLYMAPVETFRYYNLLNDCHGLPMFSAKGFDTIDECKNCVGVEYKAIVEVKMLDGISSEFKVVHHY